MTPNFVVFDVLYFQFVVILAGYAISVLFVEEVVTLLGAITDKWV